MQSNTFITFGGPSEMWHNRVDRLCGQAQEIPFFDNIIGYKDIDLKNDTIFWKNHGEFIEKNPKGYGYWIWKPYLIKKTLDSLNEGDILIYADSGCYLNKNGEYRLHEYSNLLNNDTNNYGVISFNSTNLEEWYTKRETLDALNVDESSRKMPHYIATSIIIKKNTQSIKLINEWYIASTNYDIINDKTWLKQSPVFRDHRHDQSIFSIMIKKYGSIDLPDETYFHNWNIGLEKYPILAARGQF